MMVLKTTVDFIGLIKPAAKWIKIFKIFGTFSLRLIDGC
jgi:hypothetical protein